MILPAINSWLSFFSGNPVILAAQLGMLAASVFLVFLILYTLRDILLRTHSFFLQVLCILIVAALPFIGFGFYLLIRPSRTNAQRSLGLKVDDVLVQLQQIKSMIGQRPNRPQQSPGFKLHHPRSVDKK